MIESPPLWASGIDQQCYAATPPGPPYGECDLVRGHEGDHLCRPEPDSLGTRLARELERVAPPKVEGGSEARQTWIACVLAVQTALHEGGAYSIDFRRFFEGDRL